MLFLPEFPLHFLHLPCFKLQAFATEPSNPVLEILLSDSIFSQRHTLAHRLMTAPLLLDITQQLVYSFQSIATV